MCFRMKILDILSKFAHSPSICKHLYQIRSVRKFIHHLLTNIDQFRKRSLNFSECCECLHSPSIFVSILKPMVTLVRHLEAFATFIRHLQGVCNIHRFPFFVKVLPELPMTNPASYSLRILTNRSLVIKYLHHS